MANAASKNVRGKHLKKGGISNLSLWSRNDAAMDAHARWLFIDLIRHNSHLAESSAGTAPRLTIDGNSLPAGNAAHGGRTILAPTTTAGRGFDTEAA